MSSNEDTHILDTMWFHIDFDLETHEWWNERHECYEPHRIILYPKILLEQRKRDFTYGLRLTHWIPSFPLNLDIKLASGKLHRMVTFFLKFNNSNNSSLLWTKPELLLGVLGQDHLGAETQPRAAQRKTSRWLTCPMWLCTPKFHQLQTSKHDPTSHMCSPSSEKHRGL